MLFALFFTPLLFFVQSRDQFELPKLTMLALLAVLFFVTELKEGTSGRPTALSFSLLALLIVQASASLPWTSLSWRTSLLGDYENFSGLATLVLYLAWFRIFSRFANEWRIEKLFLFNTMAAFLSSLYAIGQHFQLDFIQWNPDSVNASREFASLGNPNFLSAYLAMSIPLFLSGFLKDSTPPAGAPQGPGPLSLFSSLLGFSLLLAGTARGLTLLHLNPGSVPGLLFRAGGLLLLTAGFLRWYRLRAWWVGLALLAVLGLGLFSTASRGGFLGALSGTALWVFLTGRNKEAGAFLRQKAASVPRRYFLIASGSTALLLLLFGQPFLHRLLDSVLHVGESLALSRLHIWRPALQIVKANPLLGVGLDNFKIAFPYYSGIEFNLIDGMFMSSRMAHNELLQMASTTGLLGLAAYLCVLAAFIVLWIKAYRASNPSQQWLLIAVLASAAVYHVQNLFSFGVAAINLLWFLHLAVVQSLYRKSAAPASPSGPPPFFFYVKQAALALLAGVFLFFPAARLAADIAFGHGSAASDILKHPGPQDSPSALLYYSDYEIGHLRKAVALCPLEVKYRLYLGLAYEERAGLDKDGERAWELQALTCYQKAIQMSPANAYYYNDEGRVETALARSDPPSAARAEEAYRNAVHWDPASPFFLVNWALALEKTGQTEEARREIQRAFQLDPAFTAKVLSQMAFEQYRSGDTKTAFRYLAEAVAGNSACAEAYYCRGILYLSEGDKKKALEDLKEVKKLNPDPATNPSIQSLDQFIGQAKK